MIETRQKLVNKKQISTTHTQVPTYIEVSNKKSNYTWILFSFLEWGTKYPWKELQRQSLRLRQKERPSRDCATRVSIAYTTTKPRHYCICQKNFLKGPCYRCLIWGYASAWQIQKWMLTVIYKIEHRTPNGGAKVPKDPKGSATQ